MPVDGHVRNGLICARRLRTLLRPLKPAVFYILLALAEQESHGYAVMQAVRERSAGQVPLRTGSFYRHLAQLIEDGLVG